MATAGAASLACKAKGATAEAAAAAAILPSSSSRRRRTEKDASHAMRVAGEKASQSVSQSVGPVTGLGLGRKDGKSNVMYVADQYTG